jgi:hypothetical protein
MIVRVAVLVMALAAAPLGAQTMADMPGMDHAAPPANDMASMPGMEHMAAMPAMLGTYAMTREASGTAWQPDSSPMDIVHWSSGDWSMMAQGYVTAVYDDQGGGRGGSKAFSQSMAMLMATRPAGEDGRIGLRAMVSLDPLMGKAGYPLLFATGETADGRTTLVDRQHPHDLIMELAATYARQVGDNSLSLYIGYPGEPALGPPTFMHRASGMDNAEAPIDHHWFDSTHITFGVVTAGWSNAHWKLEASAFKGREPDQYRYDFDSPRLDSWSVRGFWNPTADLSLQLSTGHLHSPEQLHPEQNEQRSTASASYTKPFASGGSWASTVAVSIKNLQPGPALMGYLAETNVRIDGRNTVFARAERKQDDELFANDPASPLHDRIVAIDKLSLGYFRTLRFMDKAKLDLGGLASAYAYPDRLDAAYGKPGIKSFLVFARIKLAQ